MLRLDADAYFWLGTEAERSGDFAQAEWHFARVAASGGAFFRNLALEHILAFIQDYSSHTRTRPEANPRPRAPSPRHVVRRAAQLGVEPDGNPRRSVVARERGENHTAVLPTPKPLAGLAGRRITLIC